MNPLHVLNRIPADRMADLAQSRTPWEPVPAQPRDTALIVYSVACIIVGLLLIFT